MNTLQNKKAGQLSALFVLIFIDSLNYFLVIPVFQRLFSTQYGFLPASVSGTTRDILFGVATLLSPLAFIIASPIIGHLSDKWGRKKVLLGCLSFSLVGYLLPILGLAQKQLWLIFLGRFLAGTSTGSQPVAQAAVADISSGKQKAFYFALIGLAMTLAMTLGPIAGGYLSDNHLVSWFSVNIPYWIGAVLSAFNIVLLLCFFRETIHTPLTKIKRPTKLSIVFHRPLMLQLFLIFLLLEISWSQYYQVLFLFMPKVHHYSTDQVTLFMGYIGLWMSLGLTIIYKTLVRFISLRRFLYLSLFLSMVGTLGCTLTHSISAQWLYVILTAIFVGTAYASLLGLLSNHTDEDQQGWVLGLCSTLIGVSWVITGFIAPILIHINTHLPFYISSICILLAVITAPIHFKHREIS